MEGWVNSWVSLKGIQVDRNHGGMWKLVDNKGKFE